MSKATTFVAFALGAAAGAIGAWYALKKRYEDLAEEEIQSVREYYDSKLVKSDIIDTVHKDIPNVPDNMKPEKPDTKAQIDKLVVNKIIDQHDYTSHSSKNEKNEALKEDYKPFVIPAAEVGLETDYEVYDVTWYAIDDVVVDANDDPIDNVEECIGDEFRNAFGDDYTVYVQNDKLEAYYEIYKEEDQTYEDLLKAKPWKRENE